MLLGARFRPAARIDPNTVRFGVTGTEATPVHGGRVEDVNGDGTPDMVFDFPNWRAEPG